MVQYDSIEDCGLTSVKTNKQLTECNDKITGILSWTEIIQIDTIEYYTHKPNWIFLTRVHLKGDL
jgi:hypothetical protein